MEFKNVTKRLTIRRFYESDLDDFLSYQSHPIVREYARGQPFDREGAAAMLKQQAFLRDDARDVYHSFAVVLTKEEKVIGDIGLYLPSDKAKIGDLGFQFHPDYHGQGYATEAAQALIQHAFLSWNLTHITASCDARNLRSRQLIERLGMSLQPSEESGSISYELTSKAWLESNPKIVFMDTNKK